MDIKTIETIWPSIKAKVVRNEYGSMIVLTGKGSKVVANHLARENYLNGFTNTHWRNVQYGLGYAIPLYDNPLDSML
jgi:hypothetical protein